jgi:hypothetical protein
MLLEDYLRCSGGLAKQATGRKPVVCALCTHRPGGASPSYNHPVPLLPVLFCFFLWIQFKQLRRIIVIIVGNFLITGGISLIIGGKGILFRCVLFFLIQWRP